VQRLQAGAQHLGDVTVRAPGTSEGGGAEENDQRKRDDEQACLRPAFLPAGNRAGRVST
jgi:hypothetical protein